MAMMKNEVRLVVGTLADFLEAGIGLSESVGRLTSVAPKYAKVWKKAKASIEKGYPFSDSLVGVWDSSLVAVVRSGEESGNVAGIFRDIESALQIEMEVNSKIRSLLYPVGMFFGGIGVGLFFMISVIPGIAESLEGSTSRILALSISMKGFVDVYYPYLLIALVGLVIGVYYLLQMPLVREAIIDAAMKIRPLRRTISELKFGIWSRYLSLTLSSGIGTRESLKMTEVILSGKMREAVEKIRLDLEGNVQLEDAVDMSKIPTNDPRHAYLPFFVANAFATGAQTGEIAKSLSKASPALINQGARKMENIVGVGRAIAIGVAALAILSPLGIVYTEMFKALDNI